MEFLTEKIDNFLVRIVGIPKVKISEQKGEHANFISTKKFPQNFL